MKAKRIRPDAPSRAAVKAAKNLSRAALVAAAKEAVKLGNL
jgi:hypothetical protein